MPDPASKSAPVCARLLRYNIEAFAGIAVQNAIWLCGEWLAQNRPNIADFCPDTKYVMEPRLRDQAFHCIGKLSASSRAHCFLKAFAWRPHTTDPHLFDTIVKQHSGLLIAALDHEWQRMLVRFCPSAITASTPEHRQNRLLPKPAIRQIDSESKS